MGRRKIEMKLVKDSNSRQVTFSKRRNGVFKKANELVTLCGAEVAVITFSPGGKPYSYGQPGVNAVANRFLRRAAASSVGPTRRVGEDEIDRLNKKLMRLMAESEAEKKKGEMLDERMRKMNMKVTANGRIPLDGMNMEELKKLKKSLEEMKEDVDECKKELEASSCLMLLADQKAVNKKKKMNKKN